MYSACIIWCQNQIILNNVATICKLPETLSLCGNVSPNWKDFREQLLWFLAWTESFNKSIMVKIDIMLSHAKKEVREVCKILQWNEEGDNQKFNKLRWLKYLDDTAIHANTFFMNDTLSGHFNRKKKNRLTHIWLKLNCNLICVNTQQKFARSWQVISLFLTSLMIT